MTGTTTTVAPPETKNQRFRRLARVRTSKVITAMAQIGQLAGAGYESSKEEQDQVFKAITAAYTAMVARYETQKPKARPAFDW